MNRLFDPRRYANCRRLFHEPWAAHRALAFVSRRERRDPRATRLHLRGSEPADFAKISRWKKLFDRILADPDAFRPAIEDGLLRFDWAGGRVALRPWTTDIKVFTEVWINDPYDVEAGPDGLDTVVDLGANAGFFSARIAPRAGRVVALEPADSNRELARINLAGFGLEQRVELLPFAIDEVSGRVVELTIDPSGTAGHSLAPELVGLAPADAGDGSGAGDTAPAVQRVETIGLDDLFERRAIARCSLLKCDVEGAEFAAFCGAAKATLERIDSLVMEVHANPASPDPDALAALVEKLREAGLQVRHESPTRPDGRPLEAFLLQAERAARKTPTGDST